MYNYLYKTYIDDKLPVRLNFVKRSTTTADPYPQMASEIPYCREYNCKDYKIYIFI